MELNGVRGIYTFGLGCARVALRPHRRLLATNNKSLRRQG
jgi:hypothetical protein